MDDTRFASALDTDTEAALRPVRRVEVLTEMAGRRCIWTLEEKLALVAEMERCGNIAALSRERCVSTSLLYTWRRELRYAAQASQLPPRQEPMFVPVMAQASSPAPGEGIVEVEFGGAVVRIGLSVRTDLAVAIIQALRAGQ
jgi:transposase